MQIKNSFNLGKKKTFSLNIVALPEIIIFLKKKKEEEEANSKGLLCRRHLPLTKAVSDDGDKL